MNFMIHKFNKENRPNIICTFKAPYNLYS